jgi:D-alanyl-D-alanine dipeptidase
MKLTIAQRIQLEAFIGQQKGTISQIRSYGRILDEIGIKDSDGVKAIQMPGGFVRFEFDSASDEPAEFSVKQQDRELLKAALESWSGFQPSDAQWLDAVLGEVD